MMAKTPKPPRKPATYEIGYGKPPRHTQFKKGQPSHNRKGRPKKANTLAGIFKEEFDELYPVPGADGRRRRMSAMRVMVKQLKNDALKGDRAARREAFQLAQSLAGAAGGELLTAEMIREREREEVERAKLSKQLSDQITYLLEFAAAAKKAGLLDSKDGRPVFAPLGAAVARYVDPRSHRGPNGGETARAALLEAIDDYRLRRAGKVRNSG